MCRRCLSVGNIIHANALQRPVRDRRHAKIVVCMLPTRPPTQSSLYCCTFSHLRVLTHPSLFHFHKTTDA